MSDEKRRWRITKQYIYDHDLGRRIQHKAWHLYHGRKLIAKYRHWDRAWEHLNTLYRRFPDAL